MRTNKQQDLVEFKLTSVKFKWKEKKLTPSTKLSPTSELFQIDTSNGMKTHKEKHKTCALKSILVAKKKNTAGLKLKKKKSRAVPTI